jgi:excisionase family DNA binding protein
MIIEAEYQRFLKLTGSPEAAATLVLASTQSQPATGPQPMSVKVAAERLGVSKETVYALCQSGELPCTRIGRRVTINELQLATYQGQSAKPKAQYRHL